MKRYKKIISFFMLMIILVSTFQNIVAAATVIDKANLKKDHAIDTNVEFYDGTQWFELECQYVCYTTGGKSYPAYCVSHGLNGVDEEGDYTVDIDSLLDDVKIWRTIVNGYPYKTPSQLGVDSADDAYFATKQAVYCVILDRDVSLYRGITEEGKKVVEAIKKLKNIGLNGTQTPQSANLKINKSGSLVEDGDYYSQAYTVSSSVNMESFQVLSIASFPSGTYVADNDGNAQTSFSAGESFKIMIPKSKLTSNINGAISVSSKCQTYPIYYRKD